MRERDKEENWGGRQPKKKQRRRRRRKIEKQITKTKRALFIRRSCLQTTDHGLQMMRQQAIVCPPRHRIARCKQCASGVADEFIVFITIPHSILTGSLKRRGEMREEDRNKVMEAERERSKKGRNRGSKKGRKQGRKEDWQEEK